MNIYSLKNSLFQPFKSTEFHLSLSLTRKCQTKLFEMLVKTYVICIEWLDMQFKWKTSLKFPELLKVFMSCACVKGLKGRYIKIIS